MTLILNREEIQVNQIMLDPYNPRFSSANVGLTQDEILQMMWGRRETKELLASMMIELRWVNNIVVRRIDSLPETRRNCRDINQFEYVVVEGNTRLACLKHPKMMVGNENRVIPVLVAEKAEEDSQLVFENELKNIQAMANVMVVKEWDEPAKHKHIYDMYKGQREIAADKSFREIVKEIAKSTSGKEGDVRKAIFRCKLAEEISQESTDLKEDDWGYLEAFEINERTRASIGMNNEYKFPWEEDSDTDDNETDSYRELINIIPEMIQAAKRQGVNTKQFRDKYKEVVEEKNNYTEDIISAAQEINVGGSWQPNKPDSQNDKEQWCKKLDDANTYMRGYPVNEEWSREYTDKIENIKSIATRVLSQLQDNDNE